MCPSLIISVEQFPLNKNKKLDVNALVQIGRTTMIEHPETDHRGLSGVRKDESSQLEDTIRLVWAEILKVDPEGIHTDHYFFEKGGTSLSAVIASRKLSKEFQMDISVQDVFAHQTINSLVEAITKSCDIVQNSGDPTPLTFLSGGRDSMHPLIFGVLQAIGLAFMSIIAGVPIFGTAFLSIRSFVWFGSYGLLTFPLVMIGGCFAHMGLVILCKWLIIGRYRPGKAKVFSWMFLKWWLVRR